MDIEQQEQILDEIEDLLRNRKDEEAIAQVAMVLPLYEWLPGERAYLYYLQGRAQMNLERGLQAARSFRQAVEEKKEFHQAWYRLAVAERWLGSISEALEAIEEALALKPSRIGYLLTYGSLLVNSGEHEKGKEVYRGVMERHPDCAEAYRYLYNIGALEDSKEVRSSLQKIVNDPATHHESRGYALFTLAGLDHSGGKVEAAWKGYTEANQLVARHRAFNIEQYDRYIQSIADQYSSDLFKERKGSGNPTNLPLFVIGLSRAGKTLVETLLAQLPGIEAKGEYRWISRSWSNAQQVPSQGEADEIAEFYRGMLRYEGEEGSRLCVDTTPNLYRYCGFLALLFPNAKMIHCQRDEWDQKAQMYFELYRNGQSHTYHLDWLNAYYAGYQRLMAHWHKVLPGRILDVQYEELIQKPEETMEKVLNHLGLEDKAGDLKFEDELGRAFYDSEIGLATPYKKWLLPR